MRSLAALVVLAVALTGAMPGSGAVGTGSYVTVQNLVLNPPVASVAPGGSVTFDSEEAIFHHNLVALGGAFTCHLTTDGTEHDVCVVPIPGPSGTVIPYRCTLHPFMVGAVVVQ